VGQSTNNVGDVSDIDVVRAAYAAMLEALNA
jgi:hypothetical protein